MAKLRHFVTLAVVIACGVGTIFSADRNHRPIARIDPSQELTKLAGSSQDPAVPAELRDSVRKAELSRRPIRPAGDSRREDANHYDSVLNRRKTRPHPSAADPMPPTYCRSIESAPSHTIAFSGQYSVHYRTLELFESASGFGDHRMEIFRNDRGAYVASPAIDRVELVSLLTDDEPSVYVLDEMATPALARQAKRRPLDEFERLGLDALRSGEELVWTREAPTRMFGEIYAKAACLHCHVNAKEGDLLGAFTYYLKVPVDRMNIRELDGERLLEPDPATKLILDRLEDKIDLKIRKDIIGRCVQAHQIRDSQGPERSRHPDLCGPHGPRGGREDTRDAGLVYREGGAVEVVAGAAVEIDQPDLYGQGRDPDGHIAIVNRDRLWDAIDSAHELKPRSPGVRPAFVREATHMAKLFVMPAVAIACGVGNTFSADRNYRRSFESIRLRS